MEHIFHIQVKNEIFDEDWLKSFATEILNTKYKKTDVAEVMKWLTHLDAPSEGQHLDLEQWILTADQMNFHLLQWIAQINQIICILKK